MNVPSNCLVQCEQTMSAANLDLFKGSFSLAFAYAYACPILPLFNYLIISETHAISPRADIILTRILPRANPISSQTHQRLLKHTVIPLKFPNLTSCSPDLTPNPVDFTPNSVDFTPK